MTTELPKRLGVEPLIDVVFEVRFESEIPASDVLPGHLHKQLHGKKKFEKFHVSDIPKQVRDSDPNLRYVPLTKILLENYSVSIGDRVCAVACNLPYPGWETFKGYIHEVVDAFRSSEVIDSVERYSLKYVDLLPSNDLEEQVSMINADVKVANRTLVDQRFNFRIELPEDDVLHILTMVSDATAKSKKDGTITQGLVIDVDSIFSMRDPSFEQWVEGLNSGLESLHIKNKKLFFNCLSPATLNKLEPEYV